MLPLVVVLVESRLGPVRIADEDEDMRRCTDLVLADGRRIAVRTRTFDDARYRDSLTLRSRVVSGRATELQKVLGGEVPDLYLTAVVDRTGTTLAHWRIVDGPALVRTLKEMTPLEEHANGDGTAFVEVDLLRHPALVIDRHDDDALIRAQEGEAEREVREYTRARLKALRRI